MVLVGRVFDTSLNLRRIIDVYNSFIWNEYYIGYGDFQLRMPMDASTLDYIKEGWYLSIEQSDKLMFIEKIGIETDVQAGNYAVIEGRSLESMLLRRFIRNDTILTGSFQTGIMRLLQSNTLTAAAENRRINRLTFTPSTDLRITALTVENEYTAGDNLYDAIVGMCDYERVGFKVVPNWDDTSFEFSLYMGDDRSYDQNEKPWVVFSSKYENLKSSNMSLDTRELRNAAIVENKFTMSKTITDADGKDTVIQEEHTLIEEIHPEISGIDRREIFVSCSISPEEVDKSKFGKKEDRVNIRDYQEYMLLYFDSAGYKEACRKVDDKYRDRIDNPKTETIWVKTEDKGSVGGLQTTYIDKTGLHTSVEGGGQKPPWWNGKSSSKAKARVSNAGISTHDFDHEKPDWLKTPADDGFTQVTIKESSSSWKSRNARTFAAWEKSYPDRRDYETWGWDFPSLAKEQEYEAALAAAQAAIDAEYQAAIDNEIEKTRSQMRTLGLIELSDYTTVTNFEGEVDPNVQFLFGRDYYMGDIVQIVNEYDFQAKTRVVSMLFSNEEGEGFKAIPSFESDDPSEVEL